MRLPFLGGPRDGDHEDVAFWRKPPAGKELYHSWIGGAQIHVYRFTGWLWLYRGAVSVETFDKQVDSSWQAGDDCNGK